MHRCHARLLEFDAFVHRSRKQERREEPAAPAPPRTPFFKLDCGDTHIAIEQGEGKFHLAANLPPLTNLVFSGGGAKGAAYAGGVHVLEKNGVLNNVKSIYGASAGAMTAALLASGMDAREFEKLSNKLNFLELIAKERDRPTAPGTRNRGLRVMFRNVTGPLRPLLPRRDRWSMKKMGTLNALYKIRGTQAPLLEDLIQERTRASVLARIKQAGNPAAVEAIRLRLNKKNSHVTFGDLRTLSRHVPGIKELHCTGTALIDGKAQLAVFNADSTPDMTLTKAARISGAFPGVFGKVEFAMPHNAKDEATTFVDGGVMLNTPVPGLIDSSENKRNTLIFAFEDEKLDLTLNNTLSHRGSAASTLLDKALGASFTASENFMLSGIGKHFGSDVIKVPLRFDGKDYSGTLNGTLNFNMTLGEKEELQRRLEAATEQHLKARSQHRTEKSFDTLEQVLLSLNDQQLDALNAHASSAEGAAAMPPGLADAVEHTIRFRQEVRAFLGSLLVPAPQQESDPQDPPEIAQMPAHEESPAVEPEEPRLMRIDDAAIFAKLQRVQDLAQGNQACLEFAAHAIAYSGNPAVQHIMDQAAAGAAPPCALLELSVQKDREKDVRTIGFNIIRHFIYRAKAMRGQSEKNLALLDRIEERLESAKTRQQINAALDAFSAEYRPKRLPATGALSRLHEPDEKDVQATAHTIASTIVKPALRQLRTNGGSAETLQSLEADAEALDQARSLAELEHVLRDLDASVKPRVQPYLSRLRDIVRDPVLREAQTYRLRE